MADLTTSRVNRLLRPLRNKCRSLAALPRAVASRVTYSKQSSNWDPDSHPPLAILGVSAAAKKLTLDRRSVDEFELSRRIHAVCDAFKNIAHVAFGQPCSERIPSLAAMCTLVLGKHMPTADTLADPDGDLTHDILGVDGIYETVPPHCRRFLIVPHALSMILCICIHHHTLVSILLDHCLSFGLVHESTQLLNIVLAQALLPSNPASPPPVMHPDHLNYLFDLHTKWTTGNMPSSDTSIFTTSTFCQTLLDILSHSSFRNSHMLWTSRVLNKLLHTIESCDIDSYVLVTRALSQSFWETLGSSPDTAQADAQLVELKDKLSELMSNIFDILVVQHDSHSLVLSSSRVYAAIDLLHVCHAARLHCLRLSTPGSPIDLPDMIVVFATHIFVAFRNSIDNFDTILAILDDSSPVSTTFSKLMMYFCRLQGSQAFGDFVEAFLSELKLYSSALRSEKLFRLDANLWACALHHFETSITTSQKGSGTPALLTRYKRQLMEAVEIAERRCFGGDMDTSPLVLTTRSTRSRPTHRARTSGNWEWEDMVGTWIRKTPVHKKRRMDVGHPPTPQQCHLRPWNNINSRVVSPTSISNPLLGQHLHSSTLSPSSFCFSDPESPTGDVSEFVEETDKENRPAHGPTRAVNGSRRSKRRSSNFFSLLADAETNRIVLHSKARPVPKPPTSVIPEKYVLSLSLQESRHAPRGLEQKSCPRKVPPPAVRSEAILPSDDSLDLFAYPTSSPARC